MSSRPQKEKVQDNKGKIHFTFQGIRFGGCLFLFCILLSCAGKRSKEAYKNIDQVKTLLKSGDVIVRDGNDEVSETARNFNRKDKSYSHCGIVQVENDTVFVYHALGGSYNPSQRLLRQPLQAFCNPEEINKFAVFRYGLDKDGETRLSNWVHTRYAQGLPFDLFFNFYSDDKMYCSEFVFKGLNTATNGALNKYLQKDDGALYVTIDDLYLNDRARKVVEVEF